MPNPAKPPQDPARHGYRAVWIAFLMTMIGAAAVYKAKAEDDRSALVRWHHQIVELREGVNIWDKYYFPNPPMFPITLYPLTQLKAVDAAMVWFGLKACLAAACLLACMRMAVPRGVRFPWWAQGAVVLLSLRPIMGDLHHANNNLIILSLIVAMLAAWRRGYDVLAGMLLALAITYKLTPALFVPYFMYKKSWKTVAATFVGMFLFVLVIPSLVLGPRFNLECLTAWYERILGPFVEDGVTSKQEVNQSMVGVVTRMLTSSKKAGAHSYGGVQLQLNVADWSPRYVSWLTKGLSFGLLGLLALFCRTKTTKRDDPRLLAEFSLVVLSMLFASERTWKHHFVTVVLPYAFLVSRIWPMPGPKLRKQVIAAGLFLSALLMACTSNDFAFLIGKNFYKVAQFYGFFLMSGVVLYVLTAWCLWREQHESPSSVDVPPRPHLAGASAREGDGSNAHPSTQSALG